MSSIESEFTGIKISTCQICNSRDKIHMEMKDVSRPGMKRVICLNCQNDSPESSEIHAAIVLWNRKQEELKHQLSLFPKLYRNPVTSVA